MFRQDGHPETTLTTTRLPSINAAQRSQIIDTLTRGRLAKYLRASHGDEQPALRLYAINTVVSAYFLADLHYVEIALRNKFHEQLTLTYGTHWFAAPAFTGLLKPAGIQQLTNAQSKAARHIPPGGAVVPGKVVAELTFGFWPSLTNPSLEHSLWIPSLRKAFRTGRTPARSVFSQQLEQLRQLRNRVAHHEPIFHIDLNSKHRLMRQICELLCPPTADLMMATSGIPRAIMSLTRYRDPLSR